MTVYDSAVVSILEESARQAGMDVDIVKGMITTREGVAAAATQAGFDAIMKGQTVVEPRDVLGFLALLDKMEKERASVTVAEIEREFRAFLSAVKEIVPEDQWESIHGLWLEKLADRPPLPLAQIPDATQVIDVVVTKEEEVGEES